MSVLIVEDDAVIRQMVGTQLADRGVTSAATATLGEAREALGRQEFGIVILDSSLPDGSGLDLLRELRRSGSTTHVIVLSGATREVDRLRTLDLGADDYVVKPFFARELVARVLGVRRRRDPKRDFCLRAGHLEIDVAARVALASGKPLELAAKEFDLLAFLAARPGHVFSREDLLRAVWRSASDWQQAATVTEHVRRLRAKIELDPRRPLMLVTVRGAGYRFDPPAGVPAAVTAESSSELPTATYISVDGRIVDVDLAAAALLGCDRQALIGQDVGAFAAPASVAAVQARLARVNLGQAPRSQVLSLRRADGRELPVEVSSRATSWHGQPARQVTLMPVPNTSTRLRRLITGVISEVSDAVIFTDLNLHVRSWNGAAERLYGWAEHEVLGCHILDVVPWAGANGDLAAAQEVLETTGRWHGEGRQTTRDGAEVRIHGSTTLVRDDGGEPVGIVAINRLAIAANDPAQAAPTACDEADIRRAIDNDELEVYYQPLVSFDDMSVVAVEALIRWNHPDRGLLGPYELIQTAERSGMIPEIGAFVLDSACRQATEWRQAGAVLDVSVNVSTRELATAHLFDRVVATLASTGMDPHHLLLEVTETALVEDVEGASRSLHRLADLGVRISIDDFGTGWASLSYLKHFPVHALKIDRTFVEGVDRHANDAAIARSILSLGAELGLEVIAEGIETSAQQRALQELGCSMGQGFLYGRPTPAASVPVHRAHVATSPSPPLEPARSDGTRAATLSLTCRSRHVAPATAEPRTSDIVTSALRALLRIRSAPAAAQLLQLTAQSLGATLVLADDAGPDALPLDLSLGEGPPLLAVVEPLSPARMELERTLPRLVEDARQAIDLLRETERLSVEADHDLPTGLVNPDRLLGAQVRSGAMRGIRAPGPPPT